MVVAIPPVCNPLSVSILVTQPPGVVDVAPKSRRRSSAAVTVLAAAALIAACSFDYADAGSSPDQLLDQVPDSELTDATHTIVRDGRVVAEIRAERVRHFRRGARTALENVSYTEYDRTGNPVTTGSAEEVLYFAASEDAHLAGAVRLRSESQGVRVQAEFLHWQDGRRRLVSGPREVEISRDDGSRVRGEGLEVDTRSKTIRFARRVSGTLVTGSAAEDDP